jgi:hypothetical protein
MEEYRIPKKIFTQELEEWKDIVQQAKAHTGL